RLHPAGAVPALLTDDKPAARDEEHDLVIITTDDTLTDADFQRGLKEAATRGLYLAAVGRDGHFQLLFRGSRGSKLICQARFDLDEVLCAPPRASKLYDPQRDTHLPAFFRQTPSPLRFSCPVDLARAWYVHPQNVVSYTRDGRLLLWDRAGKAARQIASGLQTDGALLWCDSQWNGDRIHIVVGKRSRRGLQAVTFDRGEGASRAVRLDLANDQPTEVLGVPGAVLVFGDNSIEALGWSDGQLLSERKNLRLLRGQGRFVAYPVKDGGGVEWRALSYEAGRGEQSIGEEFIFREISQEERLLTILSPAGREGLVGITTSGAVRSLGQEEALAQ